MAHWSRGGRITQVHELFFGMMRTEKGERSPCLSTGGQKWLVGIHLGSDLVGLRERWLDELIADCCRIGIVGRTKIQR